MFRQVFNPNNMLWRILASGVDFVGLSLMWVFLCVPVVTAGPATAALYYTTVKVFRQGADDAFTLMWKSFRSNLKQGIPVTLICVPVIILICYGYSVMFANSASDMGAVLFTAYYLALVIPVGTIIYLFPLMGRFTLPGPMLIRNAVIMAIRHLPSTIILVLLFLQLIIGCIRTFALLFVAPVGGMLLASLFLEKIFAKYLNEEERAAMNNKTPEEQRQAEQEQEERKKALPFHYDRKHKKEK